MSMEEREGGGKEGLDYNIIPIVIRGGARGGVSISFGKVYIHLLDLF